MSSDIEAQERRKPGRKQLARKTKNSEKGYKDCEVDGESCGNISEEKKIRVNFTRGLKTDQKSSFYFFWSRPEEQTRNRLSNEVTRFTPISFREWFLSAISHL